MNKLELERELDRAMIEEKISELEALVRDHEDTILGLSAYIDELEEELGITPISEIESPRRLDTFDNPDHYDWTEIRGEQLTLDIDTTW